MLRAISAIELQGGIRALAAFVAMSCAGIPAAARRDASGAPQDAVAARPGEKLAAPAEGPIPVAFVLSRGATVIDFTGPWEVFQDVVVPGRGRTPADTRPFRLFTVAETREPITGSGGLRIVPDYTFEDAPQPKVIVIPAQAGNPALIAWLKRAHQGADMTMSVCTGAFQLASAGLLEGRLATTHHEFLDELERSFPNVRVRRDVRFVEGPRIATAAGLTSGIDLALRVVERYFGEEVARRTAQYMEHEGDGWAASKRLWDSGATAPAETPTRAAVPAAALRGLDPVLLTEGRDVEGRETLDATHEGYRYLFSTEESRAKFLKSPASYSIQLQGACALMARSGSAPGSGDPSRYLVHDHRIYVFATEGCRDSFKADPARYLP
jgi:putative intracellular protease/amidase/YHS domain-containing protein